MPILSTTTRYLYYDATVGSIGTGAQFLTIANAISAGKKTIFVKEGTVTETANLSLGNDVTIFGENRDNCIINMQTFQLTLGNNVNISHLTIQSSRDATTAAVLLNDIDPSFDDVRFEWTHVGNPTNASVFVSDVSATAATNIFISNCIFEYGGNFANETYMFRILTASNNVNMINCTFINGGSNVGLMSLAGSNSVFTNLSSDSTPASNAISVSGNDYTFVNCRGVSYTFSGTDSRIVGGNISASSTMGADTIISDCDIAGTLAGGGSNKISNSIIATLTFGASSSGSQIDNCEIGTINDNAAANHKILTNCSITNAYTIAGDYDQYIGCYFLNNLIIGAGTIRGILSGCIIIGSVTASGDGWLISATRVGADAGGGANTISFDAGGDNNVVSDCFVDVAISDSGAGNVITSVVY